MRFVRRITSGYNRYYKIFIFKSYTIGKELYRLFYYGVEKFMIKIASWYANFGKTFEITFTSGETGYCY